MENKVASAQEIKPINDKVQNDGRDTFERGLSLMHEFYIEFFGTLIPGVVGIVCFAVILSLFACAISDRLALTTLATYFLTHFTWTIFLVFLFLSYVVGAIVYRLPPRTLDAISIFYYWNEFRTDPEKQGRMAVQFSGCIHPTTLKQVFCFIFNRAKWIQDNAGVNIDYPYPYLRKYLYARGLSHLANYVAWCESASKLGEDVSFRKQRSKQIINIIKARSRTFQIPGMALDMMRNECHIRMLASVWFILKFVMSLSVGALVIYVGFKLASPGFHANSFINQVWGISKAVEWFCKSLQTPSFCCAIGLVIIASLAWRLCGHIECGFHYVRTREIVMILENAYILDIVKGKHDLFADFREASEKLQKECCSRCKNRCEVIHNINGDGCRNGKTCNYTMSSKIQLVIERKVINGCDILIPAERDSAEGSPCETYTRIISNEVREAINSTCEKQYLCKKGMLKGLHWIASSHAKSEVVQVVGGSAYYVVVDVRKDSRTFGKYAAVTLISSKKEQLIVPCGFAHGFMALEDDTKVSRRSENLCCQEVERGLRYDDASVRIDWPNETVLVDSCDRGLPSLGEIVPWEGSDVQNNSQC